MECPDPMVDPEGYALWCEMHACPTCDGLGEIQTEIDDVRRTCPRCDGCGQDLQDWPATDEEIDGS